MSQTAILTLIYRYSFHIDISINMKSHIYTGEIKVLFHLSMQEPYFNGSIEKYVKKKNPESSLEYFYA